MKLRITVDCEGKYFSQTIVKDLEELVSESFEPVHVSNDPLMGVALGELSREGYRQIMRVRRDVAGYLARELTEAILSEMKKRDTLNGYPCGG